MYMKTTYMTSGAFGAKSLIMKLMLVVGMIVGGANLVLGDDTVTYTITSKTAVSTRGTAPSGSSATYSQTYSTTAGQMTSGNSTTLTLSGYEGTTITGITLSMKSNSSSGKGSLSVTVGSTNIASISNAAFNNASWYGSWSTSYVNVTPTISTSYEIQSGENVVITINATANSLYIASYTITYAKPYLVTFDKEGGISDPSPIYGSRIILPSASPSDDCALQGWEFAGWATSAQSETATPIILYKEGTVFIPTATCSLHAVYKLPTGGSNITGNLQVTISNFTEITTNYSRTYTHTYTIEGMNMDIEAYGVYKNANGIQMNSGKGTYIKNLNAFPGRITNITLAWTASGNNSPTLYVDNNNIATKLSHSLGRQSSSVTTQSVNVDDSYNYFYFDGTTVTGACYLSSMTINYEYEPCIYNSNPVCTPITCPAPTPSSVSDISQNLATLNWTDDSGSLWEYYYSTENTTPTTDGTQTSSQFANLTNLNENTTYFWWVRTVCAEDDKSTWATGGSFTTLNYTLEAISNDETLGIVSVDGYVITGSPEECSKYGSPAYTITDGTATVSKDGNRFTVTPTSNCIVRINFVEKERYTVNWYVNGEILSSYTKEYCEGAKISSDDVPENPSTPSLCGEKDFMGWAEEEFEETNTPATIKLKAQIGNIVSVNNNINYYAVFATRTGDDGVWSLVTDVNTLIVGDYVIIAAADYNSAMSITQKSNNRDATSIEKSDDETTLTTITENVCRFELKVGEGEDDEHNPTWAFYDAINDGYIYAAGGSGNNYLRTENPNDDNGNGSWKIEITNSGTKITAQGTSTRNKLQYNPNNGSPLFACYSTTSQQAVVLYKKSIGGYTYSDYTTFCPCAYDIDGISDNALVWAGKNANADWNSTINWTRYNGGGYHLATDVPTSSSQVYIIEEGRCGITALPHITRDESCSNLTMVNGLNLEIAENHTLTINGAATFTSGIISGNVVFGNSASATGAKPTSHVDGKVTKNGSAEGFSFPTGSNGNLGKVEVTDGTATNVSVQYFSNPAGFGTNDLPRWWNAADMSGENPFNHVSNVEYWKISSTEAITADFVAEASTDMHFNSETAEEDRIPTNIQMAFYDNNRWTNVGGTAYISDNTLTITGAEIPASATRGISGNYTTFGSKSKSTILPIELVSFTAECNGNRVVLEWTTATERNNSYFVVERSDDAVYFTEIARLAGAGNSIEPLSYTYTDYNAHGGDNYYRLVQVDYDGTRTASEIVSATCHAVDGEPEVLVYPNPFIGDLILNMENFDGRNATVEIFDMFGRMLAQKNISSTGNSYQMLLNLNDLPAATYNVRVSTADFVINRKVVKN